MENDRARNAAAKAREVNMFRKSVVLFVLCSFVMTACTSYKSQYVSFRPPEAYPNKQEVEGLSLGAEAYAETGAAEEAFGFDIKGAGLLPVQLVLNNASGRSVKMVTTQTFLVDKEGRYWQVVPNNVALDRLEKSTELAAFFGRGAGKGALLGAAGGAILGAALGIVSGSNVAEAMGKGAAIGGAGGAVIGGTQEGTSSERPRKIIEDIREKGLEGKTIPENYLANGFIFFPGEAKSAKALKLQLKEVETGRILSFILNL